MRETAAHAAFLTIVGFALLVARLSLAQTAPDTRILFSFEDREEAAAWTSNGSLVVTRGFPTHGKRSLAMRFGMVRPTFSCAAPDAVRGDGWDFRGYDKLRLDATLIGSPMTVTMRATDADGATYTSWYYLIRPGRSVVEYAIHGMDREIDVSRVVDLRFSTEQAYTESYRVEASETGAGDPIAATLHIDKLRLVRGHEDTPWSGGRSPRPVVETPGNLVRNGDFELGFHRWSSWGTWDDGLYMFDSAVGPSAYSGDAAASIVCQKQGRGGFWTQTPMDLDAGRYHLRFRARGMGADVRMFYSFEGEDSAALTEGRTMPREPVGYEWEQRHYIVEVSRPAAALRLYFYSVGGGTLTTDAVSLASGLPPQETPADDDLAAAYDPRYVELDGRRVLVDDEPFFAIGMYHGDPDGLQGTGFNLTVAGIPDADFLDACARNGILITPDLGGVARAHLPGRAWEAAEPFRGHPAVLGWYVCDEPDHVRWNVPPPEMRLASDSLRSMYRHHLTWTVVMPWADSNIYQYVDIIATDIYPIGRDKPSDVGKVAHSTDVMRYAAGDNQPVWAVLQSTDVATPGEEVAVTYLALTHGADGVLYWEYSAARRDPVIWETMVQLSHEMRELTPVLTSPDAAVQPESSHAEIHTLLKDQDSALTLIAVNGADRPVESVRMTLPTHAREATVRFEDRTASVDAGAIVDDFAAYERHVYEIPAE